MNGYLYSSRFTAGFLRRLRLLRLARFCTLSMAALLMTAASTAFAQVNTCNSLTLYGAAAADGLCKSLSPTSQTHWVCELATGNPDIHLTFNATTSLHLTVRIPGPSGPTCEGNSYLAGTFPGKFSIQTGQPATICNVRVQDWVTRLNAVPQVPPPPAAAQCKAGFQKAADLGRITPTISNGYQQKCGDNKCQ